jgi:hypothetical protein
MFFARAMTRGARRHCPGLGRGVAIYATGELAKRTPDPTGASAASNGRAGRSNSGRGGREPRAAERDRRRIRALGADAQLSDAALFNVLVVAAGAEPVPDEQRAARQLDKALECLPASLLPRVLDALTERKAALVRASAARENSAAADDASDAGRGLEAVKTP